MRSKDLFDKHSYLQIQHYYQKYEVREREREIWNQIITFTNNP